MPASGEPRDDDASAQSSPPSVATATSSMARTSVTLSLGPPATTGSRAAAASTPPVNVRKALTVPAAPAPTLGAPESTEGPSLTSVELSTPPAAVVSVGPSGTRTLDTRPEPTGDSVGADAARWFHRTGPFALAALGAIGLVALVGSLVTWPSSPRPLAGVSANVAVVPMAAPSTVRAAAAGVNSAGLAQTTAGGAAPSAAVASAVGALASAMPSVGSATVEPSALPTPAGNVVDPAASAAASAVASAVESLVVAGPSGEPTDWIEGAPAGVAAGARAGAEAAGTLPRIPRTGDVDANAPRVMRAGRVVGYVEGRPQQIDVRMIDGKAVEVHCATAYERMRDAATRAGIRLVVVSGFRTMEHQQILYRAYRMGRGNLAALPGHSNHQSGRAIDLNTSSPGVLRWLNAHAREYGFRRTVPTEPWHWEYQR